MSTVVTLTIWHFFYLMYSPAFLELSDESLLTENTPVKKKMHQYNTKQTIFDTRTLEHSPR